MIFPPLNAVSVSYNPKSKGCKHGLLSHHRDIEVTRPLKNARFWSRSKVQVLELAAGKGENFNLRNI